MTGELKTERSKCPHCGIAFHDAPEAQQVARDNRGNWTVDYQNCPTCTNAIIRLGHRSSKGEYPVTKWRLIEPRTLARMPKTDSIEDEFYDDYDEAVNVLPISPKASAALTRRVLQHILREKAGVKRGNLNDEIEEFLSLGGVPDSLKESVDAIRQIGNFAAHPTKSKATGEIVAVEPEEAEWNIETIEDLFTFYFIEPEKRALRRETLNKKLGDAGKSELK